MNLLLDSKDLTNSIKSLALSAVENSKPTGVEFGTVISVEPLKVKVQEKLILEKAQLILSRNVTDFNIDLTFEMSSQSALSDHNHTININTQSAGEPLHTHAVNGSTNSTSLAHTHTVKGKVGFLMHNALKVYDKVILIRLSGGQKYLIIDRVV